LRSDLAAPSGMSLVGYLPVGAGAVPTTVQSKLRESVSVLDFGAVGDGVTDDTISIQAAITYGVINKQEVYFPAGVYRVTDTLNLPVGSQLVGETGYQYATGFGIAPKATTINFQPASLKSLFVCSGTSYADFRFHYSIEGFYLLGNSIDPVGNSEYALKLDGAIYARYENIGIQGFRTGILCDRTINNRFCNIYISGKVQAVFYAGNNETTDVWEQCSFFGSPIGVRFEGASVSIRFNSCLWEQIDYYGMDVHSSCQAITVTNAYCEDVPFNTDASSCMFRVGLHTGSSLANIQNHLIVTGGVFNGRNAGASGQLFNIGSCWGIMVSGIVATRWPLLFSTDPVETKPNSIVVTGIEGISWTSMIDDTTKWTGVTPTGVLNNGAFDMNYKGNRADFYSATITALTNSQVVPGPAWYPNTDGAAWLGLGNLRWAGLYASTGTINTSDAREKQQVRSLTDAEHAVAVRCKGALRAFKFNDAVEAKGDGARIHFGALAQDVEAAFAAENLNASKYGLFCYDEWDAVEAVLAVDGSVVTPAQQAGSRYGVRYEELLAFIIAAL